MIRESKAYQIQQKYDAQRTHMTVSLFDTEYPSEYMLNASNANLSMILDEYFEGIDSRVRIALVTDTTYKTDDTPGTNFFFIKAEKSDHLWVITSPQLGEMRAYAAMDYVITRRVPAIFNGAKFSHPMVAAFNAYKKILLDIPEHAIVNIAEMYLYFRRFVHEAAATHKTVFSSKEGEESV